MVYELIRKCGEKHGDNREIFENSEGCKYSKIIAKLIHAVVWVHMFIRS